MKLDRKLLGDIVRTRRNELAPNTMGANAYPALMRLFAGGIDVPGLIQEIEHASLSGYSVMVDLFNLVPIITASHAQVREAVEDRFLDVLIALIDDGYFVVDLGKVGLKNIKESVPFSKVAPGIWVSASGWPYDAAPKPAQIHWLNRLAEKSPEACLVFLTLMWQTQWPGAKQYFNAFDYKHQILTVSCSQKALRLYKNFGWDECISHLKETDISSALELELGL
jgi:hypothetical protein